MFGFTKKKLRKYQDLMNLEINCMGKSWNEPKKLCIYRFFLVIV